MDGRIPSLWTGAAILILAATCTLASADVAEPGTRPASPQSNTAVAKARAHCRRAKALEGIGRYPAAEAAYLKALESSPAEPCAVRGLDGLAADTLCAYAKALGKKRRSQAEAAYQAVLKTAPTAACATTGLEAVRGKKSAWKWLSGAVRDGASLLAAIVAVLLFFGLLSIVLLHGLTRWSRTKDRWPASGVRRPSLEVADFAEASADPLIGKQLAALVRSRVNQSRERRNLDLVTGQATVASSLDTLSDVAEAQTAVAVVKFLTSELPYRRYVVSGELHSKGDQGVGLSVSIRHGEQVDGQTVFWTKPLQLPAEGVEGYQALATPAAAWTDFKLAEELGDNKVFCNDAVSWALFRTGVEIQRVGDDTKAEVLYTQALGLDPQNAGALANLGLIALRSEQFDIAQTRLASALAVLDPPSDAGSDGRLPASENPDWYRVKYNLAALNANWAATGGVEPDDGDQWIATRRHAVELALRAGESITRYEADSNRRALVVLLQTTIEPAALVLVAGTLPPPDGGLADVQDDIRRGQVLETLKSDQPDPALLISFVESNLDQAGPRVHYNLACLHARSVPKVSDVAAIAMEELETAVMKTPPESRKTIVEAAKRDPALQPLRGAVPGFAGQIEKLLDS